MLVLEKIVIDVISLQPLIIMWPSINASPPTIVPAVRWQEPIAKMPSVDAAILFANHFA